MFLDTWVYLLGHENVPAEVTSLLQNTIDVLLLLTYCILPNSMFQHLVNFCNSFS